MKGKTAMVWRLEMWKNGNPVEQANHCEALGLNGVMLKIVDGRDECWGGYSPQNCQLLEATIRELKDRGIAVGGWGWTYGGKTIAGIFMKSKSIAFEEGRLAGLLCIRYDINEFWIDAEGEYNRSGMETVAQSYMLGFSDTNPDVRQLLCSYRFPSTYQPNFPIEAFEPYLEGWSPQVYFLGDNREDGGARQLETSFNQYMQFQVKPFVPVAPTYNWKGWRASRIQLTKMFEKAVELGCEGISVWDLPQASADQIAALRDFQWPETPEPPSDIPERIRSEASAVRHSSDRLIIIANELEN